MNIIEIAKEIFLKTGNPGFILKSVYDVLVMEGEIEPIEENLEELISQVEVRLLHQYASTGTIGLKQLASLRSSSNYQTVLEEECKKQAVANYFTLQYQLDNF